MSNLPPRVCTLFYKEKHKTRMENIPPTFFSQLSIIILVALWIYFFIYSYRSKAIFPWGFSIVILGILVSGIGYHFYNNKVVVFSISLSLTVGLIGVLWNINNIRDQFHVEDVGEFLRSVGIGLIFGFIAGFFIIITQGTKYVQIDSRFTTNAFIIITVQTSMAEELIFRGFLLDYLRKCKTNHSFAVVFQALIFAALHMPLYLDDWRATFFSLLFGVTAGYLTWKSSNLISALVLHVVANLIAATWSLSLLM